MDRRTRNEIDDRQLSAMATYGPAMIAGAILAVVLLGFLYLDWDMPPAPAEAPPHNAEDSSKAPLAIEPP